MRGIRILWVSCLVLPALTVVTASAQASKLTLKSKGNIVAPGTGASGSLRFGPCGSFKSTGTLTNNQAMVDTAVFTAFENNPGGCGEGGPSATGQLERIQVSANGMITLSGKITYTTLLPKKCEYTLTKLKGKLTLPGATAGGVSGTAKRVTAGSEHGCKGALHLTGEEAALDDLETGTPFEAEV
jgi:hypothetical protein